MVHGTTMSTDGLGTSPDHGVSVTRIAWYSKQMRRRRGQKTMARTAETKTTMPSVTAQPMQQPRQRVCAAHQPRRRGLSGLPVSVPISIMARRGLWEGGRGWVACRLRQRDREVPGSESRVWRAECRPSLPPYSGLEGLMRAGVGDSDGLSSKIGWAKTRTHLSSGQTTANQRPTDDTNSARASVLRAYNVERTRKAKFVRLCG